MCLTPKRTTQIEINFFLRKNTTRHVSDLSRHFGDLLFFSPIVLPLKIQQWKMVNTQRKCGNGSVASVKISLKSEEKSGTSKKHGSNFLIQQFFCYSQNQNSFASSKHIFKMKEVFVICMSDSSVIHTIRL